MIAKYTTERGSVLYDGSDGLYEVVASDKDGREVFRHFGMRTEPTPANAKRVIGMAAGYIARMKDKG